MLFDDLQEQLKNLGPDISIIKNYWEHSPLDKRFKELEHESVQEDFWKNPQQAELSKELQRIKQIRENYLYIVNGAQDISQLLDMFKEDEQELKKISPEIRNLQKAVASFKINILLSKAEDTSDAFLTINSGAGGTESQDWAEILLRMYVRFAEREGFNVSVIDYQAGEGAGIKSATLFIKGKNVYGLLKSEQGIHRLVRISPFDANKRRHTSFSAVTVAPEVPEQEITIDPSDLRIDTYRSGGAGGQHVNKTESAIRITHIPTNTVVQCQIERSQAQNKETAMKMLKAKLVQRQKEEQDAKQASIEKKKIEWGSQIRSYVLHPYKMVKDHRTDFESPQPDLVLDGDIMGFIESYLIWAAQGNA
jgi:peptide chain release factor 2